MSYFHACKLYREIFPEKHTAFIMKKNDNQSHKTKGIIFYSAHS